MNFLEKKNKREFFQVPLKNEDTGKKRVPKSFFGKKK